MIRFHTLGPAGSCHEHALKRYLAFQGVEEADIALCDDLVAAAARAVEEGNSYVLQCSAHLNVHQVTERFLGRLHVVDTFILPTQEMALVKRRDVDVPQTLGVPEPALGYVNEADWREITFETTKPVVEQGLLAGRYEAGVAYTRSARDHSETLEVMRVIGEVVTTWIVYGPKPRYRGNLMGNPYPELHAG
ncbi:hypothetical protein [Stappia sp.]|uniref:hypothetical protein n=1 Tax=Stappia sp. TaxID=1870903 RepID=UPI003C7D6CE3